MIYKHNYATPMGTLTLTTNDEVLISALFDQPDVPESDSLPPVMHDAETWLDVYFAGGDPGPQPPMRAKGTPFQLDVWKEVLKIGYGERATYKEIADILARRKRRAAMSAQAVGNAVGSNQLLIFIPCHRVVGTDGSLTGYAGGLERKGALLYLEQGGRLKAAEE